MLCIKCGHKWYIQRGRPPVVCPSCKSYKWMGDKEYNTVDDQVDNTVKAVTEAIDKTLNILTPPKEEQIKEEKKKPRFTFE